MRGKLLKRFGLYAIALSVVMAGCDGAKDGALTGPGSSSEVLITSTDGDGYVTAKETNPTVGVVSAVIDQNGGELRLGKNSLVVPAGAVDAPTTFTMTRADDEIRFDLTATRLLLNDVGAQGFLKPVRLKLSYHDASNVSSSNEGTLRILWEKGDGSFEAQQSFVETGIKSVTANLNHFSIYTLGWGE